MAAQGAESSGCETNMLAGGEAIPLAIMPNPWRTAHTEVVRAKARRETRSHWRMCFVHNISFWGPDQLQFTRKRACDKCTVAMSQYKLKLNPGNEQQTPPSWTLIHEWKDMRKLLMTMRQLQLHEFGLRR